MNSSIDDLRQDNPAVEASMRAQWDSAAAGWNAHASDIHAWLQGPTDAMCSMTGIRVGARVLDVAAGSGDQTLSIAQRVGLQGHLVFSRPERNPCVRILMSTALKHAGLPARDPCASGGLLSLGQPGRIDELFRSAGFEDVATTVLDAAFRMPSVDRYLDFVRSSASPILQILGRLDAQPADAAWSDMREQSGAFSKHDGWAGPNELLLTAGRRPREPA